MAKYDDIYQLVKRIPKGRVTNYGYVAKLVGTGARQVGYAMAATPPDQGIPWHRVVNSKGEISIRKEGAADSEQYRRLCAEGVVFNAKGRIDLKRFGWEDDEALDPDDDWIVED